MCNRQCVVKTVRILSLNFFCDRPRLRNTVRNVNAINIVIYLRLRYSLLFFSTTASHNASSNLTQSVLACRQAFLRRVTNTIGIHTQTMSTSIYTGPLAIHLHPPGAVSSISSRSGHFETDPARTRSLWRLVKGAQPSTVMSTGSIYTDPALPAARPGDGRFASAVLAPRGITVGSKRYQPLPAFSYFATSMPPPAMLRTAHYQQQPALRQVTLWLEPNDTALIASIISRYKALAESGDLPQQEWMLEAINSLLID